MSEATQSLETVELLEFDPFMDVFEEVENFLPSIANITDDSSRQNLPEILENELEQEEMVSTFELLANILEHSNSVEDVAVNVDATYQQVKETYEENVMVIFEKTKPFEKTIRSLNLLYENAGGEADVYILGVNEQKFADSANPKHYEAMRKYLKEKFYAWRMEDSPFYITYVGDIGSKSAMDKMAEIAYETRALAIVDTKEMSSVKSVIDHAKRLQIKGIPAKLGHLVIPSTWVYALGAKDVKFVRDKEGKLRRVESKMAVPTSSSLVGKLLDVRPGVYITGLEADAIIGADGVKLNYELERIESKELDKVGLVQIERHGHIQGATTANNSNNADLRKFPKVDTANALLKDIVQYCNNKAFSKWGEKYKRAFKREIEIYLNRRMKHELIEGYRIDNISYDQHEENVDIDITVFFFEVADEFDINLHGPQGGIDVKKEENK